MNVLVKPVADWMNLLMRIDCLEKEYGLKIVDELLFYLDHLESGLFLPLKEKSILLDLLVEHKIDHMQEMKDFLKKIKSLRNLSMIATKLEDVTERYGLTKLALILDDDNNFRAVDTFFSYDGFRKVYFPRGVEPVTKFHYEQGFIQFVVDPYCEFIVDEKKGYQHERIFYTSDLRFGCMTLPLKSQMNCYNFEKEKRDWLELLLFHLSCLSSSNIELSLADPNEGIRKLSSQNIYEDYTIVTDGLVFDLSGKQMLSLQHLREDVIVKNADVLVVCQIFNHQLSHIKLMIHPLYFEKYMVQLKESNERDILRMLQVMLEKCQIEKDNLSRSL